MKIVDFSELNSEISADPSGYIIKNCGVYDEKCRTLAEEIALHIAERPIILLSGPSGSGKTTTAMKIEKYLDEMGLKTHTVSMDKYFLPKNEIQIFDDNNNIDYESPYRIDIPLLQDHMMKLANLEEVDLPNFDFKIQERVPGKKLRRKKGELVLFEGIHALNPDVTGRGDIASCVYVSVRTRVRLSSGELVHPEYIRLMRRIIRDKKYRNRSITETLDMFDSVQRGENLYINPYKHRAHYELDTFHGFEPGVYKKYIEKEFIQLKSSYNEYYRFEIVEKLMREIMVVKPALLPNDALSREFIGGSKYKY